MSVPVFERLTERLRAAGIPFTVLTHAPVYTSAEAAAARGTSLGSGAKALVVKAGPSFYLLVMPADRKLDSKKTQAGLGVKSLRFATKEELLERTGLAPGAVPPFGSLFDLPTLLDPALGQHAEINFNAGDHATSIQMTHADYVAFEKPRLLDMS
ncbi:MAG TPA: YbaK/EbsC family protein [Gemmatales bacterium]|nr:YbaK/EbsC family protein [Gemmatales bacterium]HMP58278.1 YbaK/EbsC family protein [Gemmatales bacterium]